MQSFTEVSCFSPYLKDDAPRELVKMTKDTRKKHASVYLPEMKQVLGRDARKSIFGVSDPVRHQQGCTATEDG